MTKAQIKEVLDRVLTWPAERQQEAAELLTLLEAQEGTHVLPNCEAVVSLGIPTASTM
jgi:hypothetical protein